jgi:hypothetical protein
MALSTGWTNLSYVLAVIHGEVMRVMLLFYLAPLWTVVFARLILGERAGGAGLAVIGLSLAGAMIMLYRGDGLPLPASNAEWLGLSSGIGFALSNVITRKTREIPIETRSLWVFIGVTGIAAVVAATEPGAFDTIVAVAGRRGSWWRASPWPCCWPPSRCNTALPMSPPIAPWSSCCSNWWWPLFPAAGWPTRSWMPGNGSVAP